MKKLVLMSVGLSALALSGCGLRGDLERPDPMWGDPPPVETEEAAPPETAELRPRTEPVQVATTSYRDPATGNIVWVQNENGGDKPLAAPVTSIEPGTLPPVSE